MPQEIVLAGSEPDFKSLVEGNADVIWLADVDGDSHSFSYLSPQFKTMFGFEPQQWIGRSPFDLVHPDDVESVAASIERQSRKSKCVSFELRHLCQDGSYIWVSVLSMSVLDSQGNIVHRQGTVRNINDRKRLEQKQSQLIEILQSTSDFIGICNPETGILWRNKPFRKLRPDLDVEDQGCSHKQLYPDWACEIVDGQGIPTATRDGIWSGETALLDSSGKEIPTSQVIVAHKDERGEVEYFSTIIRDISEIKATELALKNAQADPLAATENGPGVVYRMILHHDGRQTLPYVGGCVQELFELQAHDLMADMQLGWGRIHPDDLPEVEKRLQHCAETLESNHATYRLVLPKKGTRWVQTWALASRMDNGDVVLDGIMIDVTELGRLNNLEHDINFRQIFDSAPDGVFLIGFDGADERRIVAANKAAEQMHRYRAGELIGKLITDLDAPHAQGPTPEELEQFKNGRVLRFEIDHQRQDGTIFPVEVTSSTIAIGGRTYAIAFYRDITESKRAECEKRELQSQVLKTQKLEAELVLANTQSQLRRMTENIPGVVYRYVVGADGQHSVDYISSNCRQLFGVEPEEVLEDADALFRWIHQEDLQPLTEAIAESTAKLERFVHEFRVAIPGQGVRWCRDMAQPQQQPNGDVIWDGVVLDVTDRREVELANEALAKATQSKDMFLANMSHELRTPLSAILGLTESLKLGIYGETSVKQRETLEVVEESGLHLLSLINEILDLAKIETGETELVYSSIDVAQICKSCLDLVSPDATEKQIRMSVDLAWELPKLRADKTRLRQILINLLGNAVKFTPQGGEIKLKVERLSGDASTLQRETLRFTVTDNGIGVDPDRLESIFEPFTQADGSLSRQHEGSGLGLSLVKCFVELHSGVIRVESEPGRGSQFVVDLPYLKQESTSKEPVTDEGKSSKGCVSAKSDSSETPLILMAEDNDHVAMAVMPVLEASDFNLLRAVNGKVAIDMALEHSPDLILMDVQMPVMDGLEAIRRIRSNNKVAGIPIIALSGFAMESDSARCIEAGADLFLSKPFKITQLISEIRRCIAVQKSA